ncbi:hypothetical protein [Paenibacillus agilis]|uniref:S1 family peptidase n=1 Tax=Paenibacillus agilis TaxID=3020863 RepID=A0A559ILK8_9BACL|nr:hypothetical protein [Paenibacillus agilis]TVX88373.1 hypothetical protein FPZ44_21055 [Paenibacillus agilis]
MKTKQWILLATLASTLLIGSSISAAEINEDKFKWITINGSISEIAEITQKSNINEIPYPLDLNTPPDKLTNKLLLDSYIEKQRIKQDFPNIKKLIESDPKSFSGHYYEADKGTVIVQITENSEALKEKVRQSIQHDDKVEFEVTKFSWADIEKAKETIIKNVKPGTVRALIPDIKNNKLVIAFDEETFVNQKLIYEKTVSSLIPQSEMLDYTTIPASSLTVETDNTHYGTPFPMGSKIGGDYVPAGQNSYNYSVCTAGYFGRVYNSQEVLVTSGHCQDNARTNVSWYQPTWNNTTIGNFAFRTESAADGSNKVADAGYITLNSNYAGRPRVPYPSTSNMAMVTGVYVSDTPGDTIYLRGANSGTTTTGKIAYSNVDIYWGGSGYGYKRSEILATGYTSMGGDSGGPILTNYTYNNALTGWTFDLAGIHTGVVTLTSTVSTIPPGTYKVYDPIWTTFTDLNLTGIKLVSTQP